MKIKLLKLLSKPASKFTENGAQASWKVFMKQSKILLTYLRLTNLKLGLLLNFGEAYLKDGIKRVINGQI